MTLVISNLLLITLLRLSQVEVLVAMVALVVMVVLVPQIVVQHKPLHQIKKKGFWMSMVSM